MNPNIPYDPLWNQWNTPDDQVIVGGWNPWAQQQGPSTISQCINPADLYAPGINLGGGNGSVGVQQDPAPSIQGSSSPPRTQLDQNTNANTPPKPKATGDESLGKYCIKCGKLHFEKTSKCAKCLDVESAWQKNKYHEAKEAGICPRCRKNKPPPGRSWCSPCVRAHPKG